jgi:hypothetical protein
VEPPQAIEAHQRAGANQIDAFGRVRVTETSEWQEAGESTRAVAADRLFHLP